MRSAGWLEGGLVSCYEKFIVDIELLRELAMSSRRSSSTKRRRVDAHEEVSPGGHFLGAADTLERFRECSTPTDVLDGEARPPDQARRPRYDRGPARCGERTSRIPKRHRSTMRSATSSKSSWTVAAPSSATELAANPTFLHLSESEGQV